MMRINSSPNAVEMYNLKNVLEAQGIECEVRPALLPKLLVEGFLELAELVGVPVLVDAQGTGRDAGLALGRFSTPEPEPGCESPLDGLGWEVAHALSSGAQGRGIHDRRAPRERRCQQLDRTGFNARARKERFKSLQTR